MRKTFCVAMSSVWFVCFYLVIKIPVIRKTVDKIKPEKESVINVILEHPRLLIKSLKTFEVPRITTTVKNKTMAENMGQSTLEIIKKKGCEYKWKCKKKNDGQTFSLNVEFEKQLRQKE